MAWSGLAQASTTFRMNLHLDRFAHQLVSLAIVHGAEIGFYAGRVVYRSTMIATAFLVMFRELTPFMKYPIGLWKLSVFFFVFV